MMSLLVHWINQNHPNGYLNIEKPTIDIVPHPPQGDLFRTMHNPNARYAHKKNVVKEISQEPCSIPIMEVLQYCPAQRRELFSSTRVVDPFDLTLITLDLDQST